MKLSGIADRVRAILTRPGSEWQVIASESDTILSLYKNYVLLLAALGPVAAVLGMAVFGMQVPYLGTIRVGFVDLLLQLMFTYLLALALPMLLSLVINVLAPTFGGTRDASQAFKTAVYCSTAAWLAGVVNVIPNAWLLTSLMGLAAGIYGIYLLKLGLPATMRCTQEQAPAYTAVVVVGGLVVTLVFGVLGGTGVALLQSVSGSIKQAAESTQPDAKPGADSSQTDSAGAKDEPFAKLDAWSKRIEAAGKQLEQAQSSGDPKAQVDALGKMLGTVMGGGDTVEALSPEQLKALLPERLMGLQRSHMSAERNAALGMQMSEAKARYDDSGQHELQLSITDTGSAKGLMVFADWIALGNDKLSDDGYEKTYKQDGRLVHEEWQAREKRGEYSVVVADRFAVKLSGTADSIDAFKAALAEIDLAGLEALKDQGVQAAKQ